MRDYSQSSSPSLLQVSIFRSLHRHPSWSLCSDNTKKSKTISLISTDVLPLDLLSFILERDTSRLVPGVRIKEADGVRGVQFVSPDVSMSFPLSQLLVNCDLFPKEFSIVLTLKVSRTAAKVSASQKLLTLHCLVIHTSFMLFYKAHKTHETCPFTFATVIYLKIQLLGWT